jgi:hypothetical protein
MKAEGWCDGMVVTDTRDQLQCRLVMLSRLFNVTAMLLMVLPQVSKKVDVQYMLSRHCLKKTLVLQNEIRLQVLK